MVSAAWCSFRLSCPKKQGPPRTATPEISPAPIQSLGNDKNERCSTPIAPPLVGASPASTPASQNRACWGPRVAVDVTQLLDLFLFGPYVEIVKASSKSELKAADRSVRSTRAIPPSMKNAGLREHGGGSHPPVTKLRARTSLDLHGPLLKFHPHQSSLLVLVKIRTKAAPVPLLPH